MDAMLLWLDLGVKCVFKRREREPLCDGQRLKGTLTAVLVRQVLGAIAQFEKAGLVAKLAAARKRKRIATGKCEGRKSHAETNPAAVALAKALSRKRPKGGQMSLRAVAAEMAAQGFLNERGAPFNHKSIGAMLAS